MLVAADLIFLTHVDPSTYNNSLNDILYNFVLQSGMKEFLKLNGCVQECLKFAYWSPGRKGDIIPSCNGWT